MKHAVLFDLDGTLIDYEACVRAALDDLWTLLQPRAAFTRETFLAAYGLLHREDEAAQLEGRMTTRALLDRGDRFARLLARLGQGDDALGRLCGERYETARREHTTAFPGADETLRWLRARGDVWLAIVTEGSGRNQRRQLERLGWTDLFHDIVVSAELGLHKPDPRLVDAALQRSGAAPARAIMIGDRALWDLQPAKSLGLRTVLLRSSRYAHETEAGAAHIDAAVDDHAQLRAWLERVLAPG